MKQFKFVPTLILSMVTCGIYTLYMWFKMNADHNAVAAKYGVPTISKFIVALLLGMVTCGIYSIIWMYKFANQAVEIAKAKNVKLVTDTPIVMFIFFVIPIFNYYVLCSANNAIVEGE